MSRHCAFLFPQKKFELTFMTTVGYISDNVFYRLDLSTGQTDVQHSVNGRSYQALAASHKRGLIVLADYGKNPNIFFDYLHFKEKSFVAKDICKLQINSISISLDVRYLLICCGIPEKAIVLYDIQKRTVLKGAQSSVKTGDRNINKIEFNPNNSRMFAVMFDNSIEVYEFIDSFELTGANTEKQELQEIIQIKKITEIPCTSKTSFETFVWDQINNLYISNGENIFIYSMDAQSEVINYDLEGDYEEGQNVICSFLLTKKHLIIVYTSGRIEWVNKYYPDLMEEEDFTLKPFYLEKYFQFEGNNKNAKIIHATYDHNFQKILVAHGNGFFSVLDKPAQSKQVEDNEEENSRRKEERAGGNERSKKMEIESTRMGPYHVNHIVFCRQLPNTALVMTISKAGRVVLWSTTQKTALAFSDIGADILSADVNATFTILSISKKGGLVQFFSLADLNNIFLFKQFRLLKEGEIDQVSFCKNGDELACLSKKSKKLLYILTRERQQFEVLGYCNLPYTPISMCWNKSAKSVIKPKFEHVFVCIGFGIISVNSPPPISEKRRGKDLELSCQMHALRTDLDQKIIDVLPSGELITTGTDTFILKYKQPDEPIAKFNPQSKTPIPPPIEVLEAHDLETVYLEISEKKFISCGRDGTVQIRNTDNFGIYETIVVQGWKNGNLSVCSFSQEDGLFFTCGKDGLVSMWKTKEIQIKNSDQLLKRSTSFKKIDGNQLNCKFYEVAIEEEYLEKMKESISKKKKVQLQKIQQIKTDLKQLLLQNQGHDELEKLQRDQFVIDLEKRDIATNKMMENCEEIKKQSTKKVLHNEVYKKKLKQLTWNQMEEHLRGINGLKNNFLVYNYQIRKIRKAEKRRLQIILDLRRNQMKELKKRGGNEIIDPDFYRNKNVINGGVLQPLILTIFQKKDDKKQEKGKKKKEQDNAEKQPEDLEEVPKDQEWALLYSSFQLFSENAKKNQIVMMQNLIIKIKQAFNKEFNKLMKLRQGQNEMINDKNKRIIEICDQLKRAHEIILSNKNILENPDTVLEIDPKQIPFARYLSREERQKLEKERLKEEERLRKLAEDDSSQRALVQMMGGTLQEKKASLLEATMQRQKWMDKPIEEMTQQQKAKLKEFEQKKQKAEEEKERIIKKLEAELRKLRQEIDEVMEKYDEKLFNLIRRRIEYDLRIEEQELYCLKLNLSMVNEKQQTKKHSLLKNKIAETEAKALDLETYLREFQKQYDHIVEESMKSAKQHEPKASSQNQPKIKTVEKSVFQDYQTNVRKRRQIQEKLLENNKIAQYQINSLDPFKQIESRILAQENSRSFKFFIPEIRNLQQTYDFPDSLFQILEARFNHKLSHIDFQNKLKNIKETIIQIQQHITEEEANEQRDRQELETIQNYLEKCKSDLEIQCRIKQGQVEIDSNTPVPKLSDALLISKSAIDEKNANILEKAGLKIDVIKEIKSCKIQVTEQTLNLQRKQALIDELSSMIKEVQMLKVKKQMQTALSKKDTKINENEIKSLKEQIQKVRKEGEKRITLFEKKIQKVNQEIDAIKKQNKQLEVQKWNLENTVKQREKIKDMMVGENGGGNQEAAEKFQQISINRKLFDKAKQQTEQIELLRQELSKLKAKTFANFSSVQR